MPFFMVPSHCSFCPFSHPQQSFSSLHFSISSQLSTSLPLCLLHVTSHLSYSLFSPLFTHSCTNSLLESFFISPNNSCILSMLHCMYLYLVCLTVVSYVIFSFLFSPEQYITLQYFIRSDCKGSSLSLSFSLFH